MGAFLNVKIHAAVVDRTEWLEGILKRGAKKQEGIENHHRSRHRSDKRGDGDSRSERNLNA